MTMGRGPHASLRARASYHREVELSKEQSEGPLNRCTFQLCFTRAIDATSFGAQCDLVIPELYRRPLLLPRPFPLLRDPLPVTF